MPSVCCVCRRTVPANDVENALRRIQKMACPASGIPGKIQDKVRFRTAKRSRFRFRKRTPSPPMGKESRTRFERHDVEPVKTEIATGPSFDAVQGGTS